MSMDKNRYWIPNLDINKKVITAEIQYYLGPESTVRPYTREVHRKASSTKTVANSNNRAKTDSSSQRQAHA